MEYMTLVRFLPAANVTSILLFCKCRGRPW